MMVPNIAIQETHSLSSYQSSCPPACLGYILESLTEHPEYHECRKYMSKEGRAEKAADIGASQRPYYGPLRKCAAGGEATASSPTMLQKAC